MNWTLSVGFSRRRRYHFRAKCVRIIYRLSSTYSSQRKITERYRCRSGSFTMPCHVEYQPSAWDLQLEFYLHDSCIWWALQNWCNRRALHEPEPMEELIGIRSASRSHHKYHEWKHLHCCIAVTDIIEILRSVFSSGFFENIFTARMLETKRIKRTI